MRKIATSFCLLSGFTLSTMAQIIKDKEPIPTTQTIIAQYSFSGNANDESGSGNNGNLPTSGVTLTTDRFGNANSAYAFNGTEGIDLGDASIYDNISELTISVWLKHNTTPVIKDPIIKDPIIKKRLESTYTHIVSKGDWNNTPNNTYFALCLQQQSTPYALVSRGATNGFDEVFTSGNTDFATLADGNWHQLVAVWSNAGTLAFYLDGALKQTISNISTNLNSTNSSPLYIGKAASPGYGFVGALDDVFIYNVAKSNTDVLNDYNSTKPLSIDMPAINQNQPIAYPSPTKDILNVYGEAEVFDLFGNKVASGTDQINVANLVSGIYTVKSQGRSQKIVKE